MSSPVMYLNLLLKILPDEVMFDFLAQCGLTLHAIGTDDDDDARETLRIVIAIERAPLSVRDGILAGLHQIALLADEAGLEALRAVSAAHPGRLNALHLADAPAPCALWMYLRHRDLFDAACRKRGLRAVQIEPMALDHLREPLTWPGDPAVGHVRLREVTLLDEMTGGEITFKAPTDDTRVGVLDLLTEWMPVDNPARQERFRVAAATIDLDLLPDLGREQSHSTTLVLSRRGGCDLSGIDARLRIQLESWLARWQSAVDAWPNAGQPQQTA